MRLHGVGVGLHRREQLVAGRFEVGQHRHGALLLVAHLPRSLLELHHAQAGPAPILETDTANELVHPSPVTAMIESQRHGDVLFDGQVRHQVKRLKHHADAVLAEVAQPLLPGHAGAGKITQSQAVDTGHLELGLPRRTSRPARGQRLAARSDLQADILTCGTRGGESVHASDIDLSAAGTRFHLATPWGEGVVESRLMGRFNVSINVGQSPTLRRHAPSPPPYRMVFTSSLSRM